ncbi:MAG: hypothetical protein WEC41_03900 [Dongiaceae bacterium]
MSSLTAYEIHAFSGGKWQIEAIFDDRGLALLEARRLDEGHKYPAIRVVEETFNRAANATVSKTIFRGSAVGDHNKEALERQAQVRQDVRVARTKPRMTGKTADAKAAGAGSEASVFAIILILIGVVALGAGALFALRHYVGGV